MVPHANEFEAGTRKFALHGRSLNGYEINRLWRNDGGGRFTDVSIATGAGDIHDARAFTACDFDHDGDLDLFVRNYRSPSVYLRNEGSAGHWLSIRLRGTASNRDAIGARISIEAGGKRQVRWLTAGSGYLSQMPNEATFGLGEAARVDRILVRWPNGLEQEWAGAEANLRLSLEEGEPEITALRPGVQAVLPGVDTPAPDPILAGLEGAELRDLAGASVRLDSLEGPRVLVFWAPWCNTCCAEFPDLDDFQRTWGPQGAGVVGIAVVESQGPTVADAVARLKPAFPILCIARADYDRIFGADAPVPRTLVLDRGRVEIQPPGPLRKYLAGMSLLQALRRK